MSQNDHAHDPHAPNVTLYLGVCAALFALTLVTVWISKFHLEKREAVALGLTVAGVKAALVAAIFMHLWGEKKLIFYALGLTAFFGVFLAIGLIDSRMTESRRYGAVDVAAQQPHHAAAHEEHAEGAGHEAPERKAPAKPKPAEKAKKPVKAAH